MRSRAVESRFLFIKSILEGENELVKEILRKMIEDQESMWSKHLKHYLEETNMKLEDFGSLSKENIRKMVRKKDTERWESEIQNKSTLSLYRRF